MDGVLGPGLERRVDPADTARAFTQYRAYVAAIGRKIVGIGADVDDVVQDVFLMVHRDLHLLRDPDSLRDWLATITTRSAHRSLRQRVADRVIAVHDPSAIENALDTARSAELAADLSDSLERLRQLPEHLRYPWLLKHLQEWSLESIARVCHCSLSTIQRRLRDADEAIRELTAAQKKPPAHGAAEENRAPQETSAAEPRSAAENH